MFLGGQVRDTQWHLWLEDGRLRESRLAQSRGWRSKEVKTIELLTWCTRRARMHRGILLLKNGQCRFSRVREVISAEERKSRWS
jgi:hypothetical protein